jgi:hypothetical protein
MCTEQQQRLSNFTSIILKNKIMFIAELCWWDKQQIQLQMHSLIHKEIIEILNVSPQFQVRTLFLEMRLRMCADNLYSSISQPSGHGPVPDLCHQLYRAARAWRNYNILQNFISPVDN